MNRTLTVWLLVCVAPYLYSQARCTACRAGDLQIGIGYSVAKPGYLQPAFQGFSAYGDLDSRVHFGVEAEFHLVESHDSYQSYQRTYEIGGRYLYPYKALAPYAKGMIGRGDFGYPYGQTERGYNMYAVGVGTDFKVGAHFRVRAEYELQSWTDFPKWSLKPQLVSLGFAYHIDGRLRK